MADLQSPPALPAVDAKAVVVLIFFVASMIPIVRPLSVPIRIPECVKKPLGLQVSSVSFPLDYGTAPLSALIVLLISQAVSGQTVYEGMTGTSPNSLGIEPYNILLLFFSLAYICLALDVSGLLPHLAMQMSQRAATSATKLFLAFFFLSMVLTFFTSNDVVILTLSPIVVHFSSRMRIEPTAFLVCVFQSSNVWSSMLQIGNLSNVIVASSINLGFLSYSLWMTLPTIAVSLATLGLLWMRFRGMLSSMEEQIQAQQTSSRHANEDSSAYQLDSSVTAASPTSLSEGNSSSVFRDRFGGYFGVTAFVCCILTLLITSFYSVPIYLAAMPFGVAVLARDIITDCVQIYRRKNARHKEILLDTPQPAAPTSPESASDELDANGIGSQRLTSENESSEVNLRADSSKNALLSSSASIGASDADDEDESVAEVRIADATLDNSVSRGKPKNPFKVQNRSEHSLERSTDELQDSRQSALSDSNEADRDYSASNDTNSTATDRSSRVWMQLFAQSLSWFCTSTCTGRVLSQLPLRFIPFILCMFALVEALDVSGWLPRFADVLNSMGVADNLWSAVFAVTFLSAAVCAIISNFPMTLLFTRVLQSPYFPASDSVKQAAMLAVVIQSNTAPNLALSGALGGLVWLQLLKEKNVFMSWIYYTTSYGFIAPIASIASCVFLVLMAYALG